ncbi:major capsid protein P2 [Marinobacter adhaerens]|uniref:major capsid protein P2 n=1 Tax=Marinobacter adhaerens TaxID=1033846 RepID=UPI003D2A5AF0
MQRITYKFQSPNGVGGGNTAQLKLSTGSKYHDLQLVTNMDLADITEIRIQADNKVIHRYSATERDIKNKHFNSKLAFSKVNGKGVIFIPFDRLVQNSRLMEEMTAIQVGFPYKDGTMIRNLTLEVDIADGVANPSLDVWVTTSAVTEGYQGKIMHEVKHTRSAAGSGELQIADLPFNAATAEAINDVFFIAKSPTDQSAVAINEIKVERDGYKAFERTADLNTFLLDAGERNPQANVFTIDWTEKGYGGNALDLRRVQDYRYTLKMAAAAQITVLSSYVGMKGE